jgi:hypothetical protein
MQPGKSEITHGARYSADVERIARLNENHA